MLSRKQEVNQVFKMKPINYIACWIINHPSTPSFYPLQIHRCPNSLLRHYMEWLVIWTDGFGHNSNINSSKVSILDFPQVYWFIRRTKIFFTFSGIVINLRHFPVKQKRSKRVKYTYCFLNCLDWITYLSRLVVHGIHSKIHITRQSRQ